jgi:DNA-binding HxlR family transcriptional regulator
MKERVATDGVRQWCDGTSALVERLSSDDQLPRQYALSATAAILRLRLAVAHSPAPDAVVPSRSTTALPKKAQPRITTPKVIVEGAQKLVLQFIEQHPDVRTKDLVDGLGKTLSPRTIKRCLKELATAGLLKRVRQEDRSVQYRVDTQS